MDKTCLDKLIRCPLLALQKIGLTQEIVELLTDNPSVDMDSEEADAVFDKYLFDYLYVDNTTQTTEAYVCVEAEVANKDNRQTSMETLNLYVVIYCHKNYMRLSPEKFVGLSGNRRDNLARYIVDTLDGKLDFGVGALIFKDIRTISAPAGFSARELTFTAPIFRNGVNAI